MRPDARHGAKSNNYEQTWCLDAAVVLEIGGERFFVADAGIAKMLLETCFPYKHGPSYKRALDACVAFTAGIGTTAVVRVTLVVAAMEAGFRFEVIQDREIAWERLIETERALRLELFGPDFAG